MQSPPTLCVMSRTLPIRGMESTTQGPLGAAAGRLPPDNSSQICAASSIVYSTMAVSSRQLSADQHLRNFSSRASKTSCVRPPPPSTRSPPRIARTTRCLLPACPRTPAPVAALARRLPLLRCVLHRRGREMQSPPTLCVQSCYPSAIWHGVQPQDPIGAAAGRLSLHPDSPFLAASQLVYSTMAAAWCQASVTHLQVGDLASSHPGPRAPVFRRPASASAHDPRHEAPSTSSMSVYITCAPQGLRRHSIISPAGLQAPTP